MAKLINIIGNKYNMLTVTGQTKRTPAGNILWDCLCECGNITTAFSSDLKNGTTKSCGCFRKKFALKDISGERYGRLTVVSMCGVNDNHNAMWKCICDCGKEKVASSVTLIHGFTKSCGCLSKDTNHNTRTTHGLAIENGKKTKLYRVWCHIVDRCTKINDNNYKNYGERGIKICNEWKKDYKLFHDWSILNGYKQGLSIDRIDNDGNYSPENCRWTTIEVQNNNKRTSHYVEHLGTKYTITQIAELHNIKMSTFSQRIKRGYTVEQAITKITNRGIKLNQF